MTQTIEEIKNSNTEFLESLAFIRTVPITGQERAEQIAEIRVEAKDREKALEKLQKELTAPALEEVDRIRAAFKAPRATLLEIVKTCDARLVEFEAARRAAESAALEAAGEAFRAGDSETGAALVQSSQALGTPSAITMKRAIEIEITDPDAVPREFCSPDPVKIRAHREALLARELAGNPTPGLRVVETQKPATKARRGVSQ